MILTQDRISHAVATRHSTGIFSLKVSLEINDFSKYKLTKEQGCAEIGKLHTTIGSPHNDRKAHICKIFLKFRIR